MLESTTEDRKNVSGTLQTIHMPFAYTYNIQLITM